MVEWAWVLPQERREEERAKAQEIAHERARELAREQEHVHHDDGLDHEL